MSIEIAEYTSRDTADYDDIEEGHLHTNRSFDQHDFSRSVDDGYDTEEDYSSFHAARADTIVGTLPRSKALFHYVATPLLLTFFIIIPLIIAITSYLSVVSVLICWVVACFSSFGLYYFIWTQLSPDAQRQALTLPVPFQSDIPLASEDSVHPPSFFVQSVLVLKAVNYRWPHELYQLSLTLLSCSVWIVYTYNLSYVPDVDAGVGEYDYELAFSDRAFEVMIGIEYFLIVSFSLDYLVGLWTSVNGWLFVFNRYRMIDLLCFVGVAYMSFTGHGFAAPRAVYSYYLLQGFLRFLRLRRSLSGLDAIASKSPGWLYEKQLSHDYTFRLTIGPRQALSIIVMFRVFLYLMSSAALILAVEFPCMELATDTDNCSAELQQFHLCIYFIVVTLSTVGYGDITCGTTIGRMVVTFSIILAILQIPQEMEEWNKVKRREEALNEMTTPGSPRAHSRLSHSQSLSRQATPTSQQKRLSISSPRYPKQLASPSEAVALLSVTAPLHAWAVREIENRHSKDTIRQLCTVAGLHELDDSSDLAAIDLVKFLLGTPHNT